VVEHRRSALRTAVVWEALEDAVGGWDGSGRVVDLGGGTGGFAVRLAGQGHEVTVVDPSPDALAALDRRAAEADVADLVRGVQGDASDLLGLVGESSVDLVLCHGVLEVVDDPAVALATLARVVRPGGVLSLLVAQRHAAVVARAMAGHFQQALTMLDPSTDPGRTPRGRSGHRYTDDELGALVRDAGLTVDAVHGIRVFTDLVPGSLLDLEPGATAALVELEQAVATRPEYLPLATQLHLLAHRPD
jgi:S-adenosylmethionine-dependent methyltransferase